MTEFDSVSYRAKFAVSKEEVTGRSLTLKRNEMVLLKPQTFPAKLIINTQNELNKKSLVAEMPVILISRKRVAITLEGRWQIEHIAMSRLATLMAFKEFGLSDNTACPDTMATEYAGASLELQSDDFLIVSVDRKITTTMDIVLKCSGDQRLIPEVIFQAIRNDESFWLAQFLLSQVVNAELDIEPKRVSHACKAYGVSESYFRRMCHHTFTRAPKQQMKIWRAAHSALQLIESSDSIAAIAVKNGYSSSSHFSVEIKKYFGITPREFKKLEGFLNE